MFFSSVNSIPISNSYKKKVEHANKSDVMNYDVLKENDKKKHGKKERNKEGEKESYIEDDDTGSLIDLKW